MAADLHLCLNCLETGARPLAVGPDKGTQRDTYRDTLDLCQACATALTLGDLSTFVNLHAEKRTIRRTGQELDA